MTTSFLQRLVIGIASATLSLTVVKANSTIAATIEASFSGKTGFGLFQPCNIIYNPEVCALNGQGSISGTLIYNLSETPISPTNAKPIFFEADFIGLVNSFGLLSSPPNYINVKFSTGSVTDFSLETFGGSLPSPVPVLIASISDSTLPELQSIDLFIQGESINTKPLFELSTPLPGGGSRILSEGPLEFTQKEVFVPEPSSLLGIGVFLGFGVLSLKNKKHLKS